MRPAAQCQLSELTSMSIPGTRSFAVAVLSRVWPSARWCRLICEASPQSGAPIVIAVHGTWPGRRRWTKLKSPLFTEVADRLPGVGLYRFEWSGANGATHRLIAATALRHELNAL